MREKNLILVLLVTLLLSSWFGLVSVNAQIGTIQVTTSPVQGQIFIDDSLCGSPGSCTKECDALMVHTISFGEVEGYEPPNPLSCRLRENETYSVVGYYKLKLITGSISVTTDPGGGKIFIDSRYVGTGSFSGPYEHGTYKISFGNIVGYVAPAARIVIVTEGETMTIRGVYEPLAPAIAPIIQLYSTKTTVTSELPGLLTISAVNPMGNPVMTAETVFTVDPGVEVSGVGTPFVSFGAGQYIGKFIVLPEDEKHFTVSVRALKADLTSFTVKAQTIYYFGDDIANRQMLQNTITFKVVPPPTPIPTPVPVPPPLTAPDQTSDSALIEDTPTPTQKLPGLGAVFTIAGWLVIAFSIRKRK